MSPTSRQERDNSDCIKKSGEMCPSRQDLVVATTGHWPSGHSPSGLPMCRNGRQIQLFWLFCDSELRKFCLSVLLN